MIKIDELVTFINKNDKYKLKNPLKRCLFTDAKIVENTT